MIDSSPLHPQRDLQSLIFSIAHEAGASSSPDTALVLLKLKEVFHSRSLTPAALREARRLIWQSDLIHLMVEALRADFSATHGQWYTAAELARILADVCASLKPETATTGKPMDPNEEELVNEYYNFLLPAAVDSLLVLANNIHECEASVESDTPSLAIPGTPSLVYLDQFSDIIDALVTVCSAHKLCTAHSLQSPYLLHLLIVDNPSYSLKMLKALSSLVQFDPSFLPSLPHHIIQSLLDELVYKASSSQTQLVIPSVSLLAALSHYHTPVMDSISERYEGLASILQRWGEDKFDSQSKQFIASLCKRVLVDGDAERENVAAAVIQAGWRGYCSRKKLKRAHQGISRFQKMYRRKKALENARKKLEDSKKIIARSQATQKREQIRLKHETQLSLLEKLPATSAKQYLLKEQQAATVKLQSWWRGIKARERIAEDKERQRRERSASIIQRGVSQYLAHKRDQEKADCNQTSLEHAIKPLTREERDRCLQDIVRYRNTHPPQYKTDKQLADCQAEVAESLREFYASRNNQHQQEYQRNLLLTELERQSQLLLSMPSVTQSTPETVHTFLSGSSRAVARMGERAHLEELRAMQLPWWERFEPEENLQL